MLFTILWIVLWKFCSEVDQLSNGQCPCYPMIYKQTNEIYLDEFIRLSDSGDC